MKITGFTIIKNAINNDYPIVEAIKSILPVVDEMIVLLGDSSDATNELIHSIQSPKLKFYHSVWDPKNKTGGTVLAQETNKALEKVSEDSDWAFYIQADELVHEKYHQTIREACEKYKDDKEVEGLVFNYLHFYGSYDYVGDSRKWYNKEIRIIRPHQEISSYKDAQGFRKYGKKLKSKLIDAYIYHYGWVKNPKQMQTKINNFGQLWGEEPSNDKIEVDYNEFDSLQLFTGSHPSVLEERIKNKNWDLQIDISKKKFKLKDRILYWIEKKTNKRLFAFKNYKLI